MADNTEIENIPEISEDQQELLTAVDEESKETVTIPGVPEIFEPVSVERTTHEITSFLKRPLLLLQDKITSEYQPGKQIFHLSLPTAILQHPMILPKVQNFRFIRGTIVVRVVFNAQPFQQGIFRLITYPVLSQNELQNTQFNSLTQLTGLNGVDYYLQGTDKTIELEVPYIYPNPSYDMLIGTDDWGLVDMYSYAPLRSNDSTQVSYTVYAFFKDVEISMPQSQNLPLVAKCQIGRGVTHSFKHVPSNVYRRAKAQMDVNEWRRKRFIQEAQPNIIEFLWLIFNYLKKMMMGKRKAKAQVGVEQNRLGKGTVSSIAGAVSNIATAVSGVPFLSSIAAPVAGIAQMVGNVASMFGWSKPLNDKIGTKVRYRMLEGMNNVDGVENSSNMALYTNNRIDVSKPVFGTNIDEMAISSIVRIPHFISTFNVTINTAVNTLVASFPVNPMTGCSLATQPEGTMATMTSLGYIGALFELWRGSIVFTFKVSKTPFHTTRLMLVWFNTESLPPATYDCTVVGNYSVLWDVTTSYEQQIIIPYIQAIQWLNVHTTDSGYKARNGYVGVYVINQLMTTSIAANQIDILVEISAGPDMTMQIPRNPGFDNYFIQPVQTGVQNGRNIILANTTGIYGYTTITGLGPYATYKWGETHKLVISSFQEGIGSGMFANRLNPQLKLEGNDPSQGIKATLLYTDDKGADLTSDTMNLLDTQQVIVKRLNNAMVVRLFKPNHSDEIAQQPNTVSSFYNVNIDPEQLNKLIDVNRSLKDTDLKQLKNLLNENVRNDQLWLVSINEQKIVFTLGESVFGVKYKNIMKLPNPKNMYTLNSRRHREKRIEGRYIELVYPEFDTNTVKARVVVKNPQGHVLYDQWFADSATPILVAATTVVAQAEFNRMDALTKEFGKDITGAIVRPGNPHFDTVGENIQSLRALLKRYNYRIHLFMQSLPPKRIENFNQYISFDPFNFSGPVADNNVTGIADYVDYVAASFRFFRGEMRYKALMTLPDGTLVKSPVDIFYFTNYNSDGLPDLQSYNSSRVTYQLSLEGCVEFTTPYYNRNEISIIGTTKDNSLISSVSQQIVIFTTETQPVLVKLYRAFGEHASFGYYLGPPTCLARPRAYILPPT